MPKSTVHPHHKMYEKHSKEGHINHLGNDHFEKKLSELPVADEKYASEMGAAEELHNQVAGLSNYLKKHKMKY